MAQNLNAIKGTPRAVGNDVLVTHMHFGEQTTASGLIIKDDNGSTRGIYPRWARVYSIGSTNEDTEFEVGDWILIKHGRWTRALALQTAAGEIVAMSKDRPDGLQIGAEYSDGQHATVDPSSFINA